MPGKRIIILIIIFLIIKSFFTYSQNDSDSLVVFSDLKFHSDFEKRAISNFITHKIDTFNLLMAIDENMDDIRANACYNSFQSVLGTINVRKLGNKTTRKQIKQIFTLVHENFLRKYNVIDYFPQIFIKGSYNCVSASMLYSLVFNQLGVPYKIFQTPNHVYLVTLPGNESMIIETTDPNMDWEDFTEDFKKKYISNLRYVKVVSENEAQNKSVDELFHEKYYKGKEAQFNNLAGFDYFNKGLMKLKDNETNDAYILFQKAYFFFPDQQVKSILYDVLIQQTRNCKFLNVSDIDYLVQLSRFDHFDTKILSDCYTKIVMYYLQFTDKIGFCDSMNIRLTQKIEDKSLADELSFSYYLMMSKHFINSDQIEPYIEKAIAIRQNHIEANNLFLEQLEKRLDYISNFNDLKDSIDHFAKKYNYIFTEQLFHDYRLIAILSQAIDFFSYNKISEGEEYLKQFETVCNAPIESNRSKLVRTIEQAYRTLAVYYFYNSQKQKAQQTIDRGLKYVPGSRYIQTAVY